MRIVEEKMLARSVRTVETTCFRRLHASRLISTNSWAAKYLQKNGEKLEEVPPEPYRTITPELLNNPPEKIQKLAKEILNLNGLEASTLWRELIGVRLGFGSEIYMAAVPGAGGGGGGGAAAEAAPAAAAKVEPVKEKEAFDIKIGAVDAKAKIKVIKEVRTITGLGLKEVCPALNYSVFFLINIFSHRQKN